MGTTDQLEKSINEGRGIKGEKMNQQKQKHFSLFSHYFLCLAIYRVKKGY
jgi:hypothetical protein